jgi:hypothetical protein
MTRQPKLVTDEELITAFASGIDGQRYTSVYAQTKNFVVFRIDGHKYWSALYQPWSYTPVRHVLIRKGDYWLGNHDKIEWEGRVTKAVEKQIFEALEQSQDAGEIVNIKGLTSRKFSEKD